MDYVITQLSNNIISRWQTVSHEPVFGLFFVLVVIWGVGVLFQKFNLPLILGELLAGIVIGPPILGWVQPTESFKLLADLGAIFLVFFAGLETDIEQILKSTVASFLIALGGTILPLVFGFLVVRAFGGTVVEGLFIGAAISTTSLVTGSRIFHDLNLLKSRLGHALMGASIYDNLFSLALFILILSVGKNGTIDSSRLIVTLLEIAIFIMITIFIGQVIYPRLGPYFSRREAKGFTFALFMALLFGIIAQVIGFHMIMGAYLAGLFVREEILSKFLYQKLYDRFYAISYGFLGPFFFISLSFYVSLDINWQLINLFLALLATGIFSKTLGAALGANLGRLDWKESLSAGVAMNSRGLVELVFVLIAIKMGIVRSFFLNILIMMAVVSTFLTPLGMQLIKKTLLKNYGSAPRNSEETF